MEYSSRIEDIKYYGDEVFEECVWSNAYGPSEIEGGTQGNKRY